MQHSLHSTQVATLHAERATSVCVNECVRSHREKKKKESVQSMIFNVCVACVCMQSQTRDVTTCGVAYGDACMFVTACVIGRNQ